MAAYRWVDGLKTTCGRTLGSAPGPTLGNEYGRTLPFMGRSTVHSTSFPMLQLQVGISTNFPTHLTNDPIPHRSLSPNFSTFPGFSSK